MTLDLDRLLRPRSIAIVGASTDPASLGAKTLATLQDNGFPGDLYPVHPSTPRWPGCLPTRRCATCRRAPTSPSSPSPRAGSRA